MPPVHVQTSTLNEQQILSLIESINELRRAVIGYNGTPGLVADVAIIKDTIQTINTRGCAFGQESGTHSFTPDIPDKATPDQDQFVSWKEIREKTFWPLVTFTITGGVVILGLVIILLSQHKLIP